MGVLCGLGEPYGGPMGSGGTLWKSYGVWEEPRRSNVALAGPYGVPMGGEGTLWGSYGVWGTLWGLMWFREDPMRMLWGLGEPYGVWGEPRGSNAALGGFHGGAV